MERALVEVPGLAGRDPRSLGAEVDRLAGQAERAVRPPEYPHALGRPALGRREERAHQPRDECQRRYLAERDPARKNRVFGRPSATSTNRSMVDEWLETYTTCPVGNGSS